MPRTEDERAGDKVNLSSLLKNSIWLWDRLSSRSFLGHQRRLTDWKVGPTYFFNGLLGARGGSVPAGWEMPAVRCGTGSSAVR